MSARGFTLLELLIILLILGIATAVAAPRLVGGLQRAETRTAAYELAAALRQTRTEALRQNVDVPLSIDVEARTWRIGIARPHPIPEGVSIDFLAAETEQFDTDVAAIRFFADGTATGGTITLADGGMVYRLQVDWLTGRVDVEENLVAE